jgi:hypothetical protein
MKAKPDAISTSKAARPNYKARAERAEQMLAHVQALAAERPIPPSGRTAWSDEDSTRPVISPAHREQLAYLASLQICDLFDSLLEIDTNIDGYDTVIAALAARGSALGGVILSAMSDELADEEQMIRQLAPRKDVEEFRTTKLRDCSPRVRESEAANA